MATTKLTPRVRKRLRALQKTLTGFYAITTSATVDRFVQTSTNVREMLLIVESGDDCEVALCFAETLLMNLNDDQLSFDEHCLLLEGISHFLYLAHRQAEGSSTSLLELELQAEVDKYAIQLFEFPNHHDRDVWLQRSGTLRAKLYDNVRYLHAPSTEEGSRYRAANNLAKKYTLRIEDQFLRRRFDVRALRAELQRFYQLRLNTKAQAAA